jgi:hypothetical protein
MSTGLDFIPPKNAEFAAWEINFVTQVNAFKAGWNWNSDATADWATLTATGNVKQARWQAAWAIVSSKEFKHSDETELKGARQAYESGNVKIGTDTSLRMFIKSYIANNKRVTATQKKAMRITMPTNTKTTTSISTENNAKLVPTYISMKHQIHLSIEYELTYPGRTSKALDKGVKEAMGFMLVQAASLTTIPDPAAKNSGYTYIGDFKRGTLTQSFTEAQEGMAVLIYMQEKSKGKKAVLGTPTKVFRIVIS